MPEPVQLAHNVCGQAGCEFNWDCIRCLLNGSIGTPCQQPVDWKSLDQRALSSCKLSGFIGMNMRSRLKLANLPTNID